jgi:hypothetical protein
MDRGLGAPTAAPTTPDKLVHNREENVAVLRIAMTTALLADEPHGVINLEGRFVGSLAREGVEHIGYTTMRPSRGMASRTARWVAGHVPALVLGQRNEAPRRSRMRNTRNSLRPSSTKGASESPVESTLTSARWVSKDGSGTHQMRLTLGAPLGSRAGRLIAAYSPRGALGVAGGALAWSS